MQQLKSRAKNAERFLLIERCRVLRMYEAGCSNSEALKAFLVDAAGVGSRSAVQKSQEPCRRIALAPSGAGI